MVKVAVSACLLGVPCRYDGASKPSDEVQDFLSRHQCEVVKVCPEVMGGMTIPHPPCEIKRSKDGTCTVVDDQGQDHSAAFEAGAQRACQLAMDHGCTHAILKAKSPSCGVGRVYDGTFSKTLVAGNGLAADLLEKAGIKLATEKDLQERFGEDSAFSAKLR